MKIFWDKGCNVIIFVHGVTKKILLRQSNLTTDIVLSPKFGNSGSSMREVIMPSILERSDQEIHFFWGMLFVHWFGTGTRYDREIIHKCGKRVKIKVRKFWRLTLTFVKVPRKNSQGSFLAFLSWIGLRYTVVFKTFWNLTAPFYIDI